MILRGCKATYLLFLHYMQKKSYSHSLWVRTRENDCQIHKYFQVLSVFSYRNGDFSLRIHFFKIVLEAFRSLQRGQGTPTFFKIRLKTWMSG